MHSIIIIPTYNEKENIEQMISALLKLQLPGKTEILIIDDASPDGTGKIVDEMKKKFSNISCIHRASKMGLGSAYREGFREAIKRGAQNLIAMDADFSHNPFYLPEMIQKAQYADLVIGSRYVKNGGQKGWSCTRRLLSWGANLFARTMLSLQTRDTTAGFKCYTSKVFQQVAIDSIHSDGYSFQIETVFFIERAGLRVTEIPIIFENRRRGASKISRGEVLQGVFTVFRLFVSRFTDPKQSL
ncbi:polyprenol monophosphomannose synthase [Patescibacteria group bacterium]